MAYPHVCDSIDLGWMQTDKLLDYLIQFQLSSSISVSYMGLDIYEEKMIDISTPIKIELKPMSYKGFILGDRTCKI